MQFVFLNKAEKEFWLPQLFALLYENMQPIAPSDMPCQLAKDAWMAEVGPALEKAPRQVILCLEAGKLAGYLQYYARGSMLMVEELQLAKAHRQTTAFLGLCRFLLRALPADLETVEAYADRRNLPSIRLMTRLGMTADSEDAPAHLVHLRGDAAPIRARFAWHVAF